RSVSKFNFSKVSLASSYSKPVTSGTSTYLGFNKINALIPAPTTKAIIKKTIKIFFHLFILGFFFESVTGGLCLVVSSSLTTFVSYNSLFLSICFYKFINFVSYLITTVDSLGDYYYLSCTL